MSSLLKVATGAALAAGKLQLENFGSNLAVNEMLQHDIKLDLDVRCQELISGILLGAFPEHCIKGEEGETTASAESKQGKKSSGVSATSETLTDFAYRSRFHSFGSGRGRGRGRGLNVGLVRVNPDETKTPICPTFLRGIRCENELCQKRHDVPIESARPVCSFFQRHGQCLKGSDCPFRHVKMNPLAMLCPSFNLLGYCDDEKCVMKHVAANKSSRNDRGSKNKVSIERSREGKT